MRNCGPFPGKRATAQQRAEYKSNRKKRLPSVAARQVLLEVREDFDQAGASDRPLLATLDGSFCNQIFFKEALPRMELLCRCRKDAVLCLPQASDLQRKGPKRFYDPRTFSPESVRLDQSIPYQSGWFFHGGRFHEIRYKELPFVLWRKGAGRRPLRLIVIAPTGYRLCTSPEKTDTEYSVLFTVSSESGDSVPRTPWDFSL